MDNRKKIVNLHQTIDQLRIDLAKSEQRVLSSSREICQLKKEIVALRNLKMLEG